MKSPQTVKVIYKGNSGNIINACHFKDKSVSSVSLWSDGFTGM